MNLRVGNRVAESSHESALNKKSVLWTKNYILLILSNAFSGISYYMTYSIMSKYFVGLGISLNVVGIIVGIYALSAMCVRPISGVAADRYNKKIIVIITEILIGLCMMGFVLSNSIAVFFIFRILQGIAFGMSGTAMFSLASTYLPKDRIGEGIGYLGLGYFFTTAVAPGIGIITSSHYGYLMTFTLSFIISVAAAFFIIPLKTVKPPEKAKHEIKKIRLNNLIGKEAVFYSALCAIFTFSGGVVSVYLLLVADKRHINNISIYFIVCAVFMIVARPFTSRIFDKKGLAFIVYPAFAVCCATMILFGVSSTLWMFLLAGVLLSVTQGGVGPAFQAECIRRVGRNRSGVANSTYFMGTDISLGAGPIIGGVIISIFDYSAVFYFCAILLFIGGVIFFLSEQKGKKLKRQEMSKQQIG